MQLIRWADEIRGRTFRRRQCRHIAAGDGGGLRSGYRFLILTATGAPTPSRDPLVFLPLGSTDEASLTNTPRSMKTLQIIVLLRLLAHPPIPEEPANRGGNAAPANDSHGTDALLMNANEAYHEDYDSAHMLYNDSRVGDQGPEVVGFQAGIALEVLEERGLVSVVIGICLIH